MRGLLGIEGGRAFGSTIEPAGQFRPNAERFRRSALVATYPSHDSGLQAPIFPATLGYGFDPPKKKETRALCLLGFPFAPGAERASNAATASNVDSAGSREAGDSAGLLGALAAPGASGGSSSGARGGRGRRGFGRWAKADGEPLAFGCLPSQLQLAGGP